MTDLTGTTLGPYRILSRLGQGGLAEVYKAYQPGLDRYVAIKVLPPHLAREPGFGSRFEREAGIVAQLRHPHIVQAYDFGHDKALHYLVMEYINGPTLQHELQARQATRQPFTLAETARIVTALCNAVDYAHNRGMLHQDLKPSNIMFTPSGYVVLTDFGLTKMIEPASNIHGAGVGIGTPTYMSPEQGRGEPVDARSDIYTLGIILYQMATGRVPYDAETPMAIIWKHINAPLPLPTSINPDLPESVERVILKAMSKDPADRYQTAEEMARALQQAVGSTPETAQPFQPLAPTSEYAEEVASAHPPVEDRPAMAESPPAPAARPVPAAGPVPIPKPGLIRRVVEAVQQTLQARQKEAAPAERAEAASEPEASVANLRLDAAVPDQVTIGRTFDVAVAVRQLSSPLLAEDDLSQVRSGDVQVSWPETEPFIHLRIAISAPECDLHGEDSHAFRLYPRQDSPVFYFHLTPRQEGDISIIVTVYQEDDWLGSARVRTVAQQQVVGQVNIDVTSHTMTPPPDAEVESLRRRLRQHRANLNILQEQAAVYALGETPLHLLNQIEAEEAAIAELEAQLAP